MGKKLCELCQKEYESDMRFGVRLCQQCLDGYSNAMSGDVDAATRFSNPQNFPDATELAQKYIIDNIANRVKQTEAKHQEEQQQQEIEKKEQKREAYAQSIGVTYKNDKQAENSSLDGLYIEIGKKIKGWAKWVFVAGAISSVISAISMLFSAKDGWMIVFGLLALVIGPLLAWVSSWILYAFGELVEKTSANEQNTRNILKLILENNTQKKND